MDNWCLNVARNGNLVVLQQMVDNRLTNHIFYDISAALAAASESGQLEAVRLLVQANANVNHVDNNGHSPFSLASDHDRLDVMEFLLEHGMDVNCDRDGTTPLIMVTISSHLKAMEMLVARGADANYLCKTRSNRDISGGSPAISALYVALILGRFEPMVYLLANHADPNRINSKHGSNTTALAVASAHNNTAAVECLTTYETTPELWAVRYRAFKYYPQVLRKQCVTLAMLWDVRLDDSSVSSLNMLAQLPLELLYVLLYNVWCEFWTTKTE